MVISLEPEATDLPAKGRRGWLSRDSSDHHRDALGEWLPASAQPQIFCHTMQPPPQLSPDLPFSCFIPMCLGWVDRHPTAGFRASVSVWWHFCAYLQQDLASSHERFMFLIPAWMLWSLPVTTVKYSGLIFGLWKDVKPHCIQQNPNDLWSWVSLKERNNCMIFYFFLVIPKWSPLSKIYNKF